MKFLKMEEKLQWKLYYIVNEDVAFKKSNFYVMRLRPMRSNWRKDHLLATIERVKQIACCPILEEMLKVAWFIHQIYRTIKNDIFDFYKNQKYIVTANDVISSPKPLEPWIHIRLLGIQSSVIRKSFRSKRINISKLV